MERARRNAGDRVAFKLFYCCAGEHSAFISLHSCSRLPEITAAASGCEPLCAEAIGSCHRFYPNRLKFMPAPCCPSVNGMRSSLSSPPVVVMLWSIARCNALTAVAKLFRDGAPPASPPPSRNRRPLLPSLLRHRFYATEEMPRHKDGHPHLSHGGQQNKDRNS